MITKSKYLKSFLACDTFATNTLREMDDILGVDTKLKSNAEFEAKDDQSSTLAARNYYEEDKETGSADNADDFRLIEGRIIENNFKDSFIRQGLRCEDLASTTNMNEAFIQTATLIQTGNVDIIFEATFIAEINGVECVARVDALDLRDNKMIELKATSTSKLKYLYDMFYQWNVVKRSGIIEGEIFPHLALIKYKQYDKGGIDFSIVSQCNTGKSIPSITSKVFLEKYSKLTKEEHKRMQKNGSLSMGAFNIIDYFNRKVTIEASRKNLVAAAEKRSSYLTKKHFETMIAKANTAPKCNKIPDMNSICNNVVKKCEYFDACKATHGISNILYNYSGNYVKFPEFTKYDNFTDYLQLADATSKKRDSPKWLALANNRDIINKEKAKAILDELKTNIYWYDFESINPAIASFDGSYPHAQAVFQLSWVKTENGSITGKNNRVDDPTRLTPDTYKGIIDNIYQGDDWSYVVFNKNFENTRLKEMAKLINEPDYIEKVNIIIDNTVDLMEVYNTGARDTPIFLSYAKGYYSIKKIEKYVTENNIETKTKIKPYPTLNVSNGSEAMSLGLKRYYGLVSDTEWVKITADLSEYCENDVYAMIMVYELTLKLLAS